ncbi:proteasome assembly chaperone family protein [Pseudonocardia nantongensis]|uniref:proteasome assembly chaperone family protein n=1 Tax=Pseudonocardia nantongensis TaxID=1181885 RepID=UPI00397B5190
MLDPAQLYQIDPAAPQLDEPVLIVVLDGFVDAGNAGTLAVGALRDEREPVKVASFDVDQLVDYRSRRPPLRFETDHWADYDPPALDVVVLTDTGDTQYLLLSGPEPDTQWERFVAAVGLLVEQLGVRLVISLQGIPMAVPHTRPIGVTAHATRPELVEGYSPWFASADVPGSAAALLEYRLGQAGQDALGFAVHVPHYLARSAYPQAARALLDHAGLAAELYLPTETLTRAAEQADTEISEQMAESDEVVQVVKALEEQYDQVAEAREAGSLTDGLEGGELPSGDELAAEFERFLAEGGDKGTGKSGGDKSAGDIGGGDIGGDEPPHEPPGPTNPPSPA